MKAETWLRCGCCGNDFKTWNGYEDQDQDLGYGICSSCQGDAVEANQKQLDEIISKLAGALSPENRANLLARPKAEQNHFAYSALEAGLIKWKIGG